MLTRANALDIPTIGYRLLSRRSEVGRHRRVVAFDGLDRLRVRSADDRPVPLQVDGDYIGDARGGGLHRAPGRSADRQLDGSYSPTDQRLPSGSRSPNSRPP